MGRPLGVPLKIFTNKIATEINDRLSHEEASQILEISKQGETPKTDKKLESDVSLADTTEIEVKPIIFATKSETDSSSAEAI